MNPVIWYHICPSAVCFVNQTDSFYTAVYVKIRILMTDDWIPDVVLAPVLNDEHPNKKQNQNLNKYNIITN